MDFLLNFFNYFLLVFYLFLPIILILNVAIVVLGLVVGRMEGWLRFESIYWAFITALTVGYGDMKPNRKRARVVAIFVAWIGIMLSGLLVAITVKTASIAFEEHVVPTLNEEIKQSIKIN